jgi:kinesin family protein 4/21/27
MVQVNTNTSLAVESPQGRKIFIFDRVFGEDVTQKAVWDYLQDSVDSFLQGYNVSLLAYGQSGAGKSYTMGTSGPREQFDTSLKGESPPTASNNHSHIGQASFPEQRSICLRVSLVAQRKRPTVDTILA